MAHQNPSAPDSNPVREIRSIVAATIEGSTPVQRALAFGAIPLLLLTVGLLPLNQQQAWALRVSDPTVAQLYLSNFVHGDIPHLANNIVSYLLMMLFLFPLAVSAGKQRILAAVSVLFVTALPIMVSLYSVATLAGTSAETVVGASGIIAGYAGSLPFFIAYHAKEKVVDVQVAVVGVCLMGIELGAALLFAGIRRWSVFLLPILGVIGLVLAIRSRLLNSDVGREYEKHLLVYGLVVFASVPVTLLVSVDGGTNVYGHIGGLIGGFLLTLTIVLVERTVGHGVITRRIGK